MVVFGANGLGCPMNIFLAPFYTATAGTIPPDNQLEVFEVLGDDEGAPLYDDSLETTEV